MTATVKSQAWLPRMICILAILFISQFATDAFNTKGVTLMQQILDFLMHLIPSFILIIVLVIAWKWELIGGIILTLIGLGFAPFIFNHNYGMNHSLGISIGIVLAINFPFILAGILFILSHVKNKKRLTNYHNS